MFRTPYNYQLLDNCVEHPSGESMTIPEQSLTVREIFERYRIGAPLDIAARDLDVGPDEDFADYDPTFQGYNDLVDVYEASLDLKQRDLARRRAFEESEREKRSAEQSNSSNNAEGPSEITE